MTPKWYSRLVKNIVRALKRSNFHVKKETRYYIIIDCGHEDIVIPKKQFGDFTLIYFIHGTDVVQKFIATSIYISEVKRGFMAEFWKRQYSNIIGH